MFQDRGRILLNHNIGSLVYANEEVATIQHCYDRFQNLISALKNACPRNNLPVLDSYLRNG